jgi:hypothetical protein
MKNWKLDSKESHEERFHKGSFGKNKTNNDFKKSCDRIVEQFQNKEIHEINWKRRIQRNSKVKVPRAENKKQRI